MCSLGLLETGSEHASLGGGKLRHAASLLLLGLTMSKSLGSLTKHCAPASKKYGLIDSIVGFGFFSTVLMQKQCGHAEYLIWLCSSSLDFDWNI